MSSRSWAIVCLCLGFSLAGIGCGGSSLNGTIVDGSADGTQKIAPTTPSGGDDINPSSSTPTPEVCNDGLDNDGNGVSDCTDVACASDAACAPAPTAEICNDTVDNDGNGVTDCADLACASDAACAPAPVAENCATAADEDGDGQGQCSDSDCAGDSACSGDGGDVHIGDIDFGKYKTRTKWWEEFGPGPVCDGCPDPYLNDKDYVTDPADKMELNTDYRAKQGYTQVGGKESVNRQAVKGIEQGYTF